MIKCVSKELQSCKCHSWQLHGKTSIEGGRTLSNYLNSPEDRSFKVAQLENCLADDARTTLDGFKAAIVIIPITLLDGT